MFVFIIVCSLVIKADAFDMHCDFSADYWPYKAGKICETASLEIISPNQVVTSINGKVGSFYDNQKVEKLHINSRGLQFMPKGLDKFFPDLEAIWIENSELRTIEQDDLKPFSSLKDLYMVNNKIDKLDSDLFQFNPELRAIQFNANKIKFIGRNILSPLPRLDQADFSNNDCINKFAYEKKEFPELIAEMETKCAPPTTAEASLPNYSFLRKITGRA